MSYAIQAGKAFIEFVLSDKQLDGQLARIGQKLRKFGSYGAAAIAPLIAGFLKAASHFANIGGELDDISKRTTVSASKLAAWGDAAEQAGADLGLLEKGLLALRKKGIYPNQFEAVAADIAAIEDPTKRGQAAMELFGKTAGAKLLPMIEQLPQLTQRFKELGGAISDEDVAAADELGDAYRDMKKQVSLVAFELGAAVAGPMTDFLKWSHGALAETIKWIKENRGLVQVLAKVAFGVGAVSSAAIGVGYAINVVTNAVKGLQIGLKLLAKNPAILPIAAIAGVFYEIADSIRIASDELLSFDQKLLQIGGKFALGAAGPNMSGLRALARPIDQGAAAQARLQSVTRGGSVQPVFAAASAGPNAFVPPTIHVRAGSESKSNKELQEQTMYLRGIWEQVREGGFPMRGGFL